MDWLVKLKIRSSVFAGSWDVCFRFFDQFHGNVWILCRLWKINMCHSVGWRLGSCTYILWSVNTERVVDEWINACCGQHLFFAKWEIMFLRVIDMLPLNFDYIVSVLIASWKLSKIECIHIFQTNSDLHCCSHCVTRIQSFLFGRNRIAPSNEKGKVPFDDFCRQTFVSVWRLLCLAYDK